MEEAGIRPDPLFKGATRPALFMGVPIVPFMLNAGFFMLMAMYFTFLFLPGVVVVHLVMRAVTRTDDQAFRLLGMKATFRAKSRLNGSIAFWKANSYSPIPFKRRV